MKIFKMIVLSALLGSFIGTTSGYAAKKLPNIISQKFCIWSNGSSKWAFSGTYNKGGQPIANATLPMNCSSGSSNGCTANVFVMLNILDGLDQYSNIVTITQSQISPCNSGNFNINIPIPISENGAYEIIAQFNTCGVDGSNHINCDYPGNTLITNYSYFTVTNGEFD